MKILITGHKGFIGSHLLNRLKDKHDVVTYEWGREFPDITMVEWVIHVGGISSTTEKDVDKIFRQNYDFSVKLYNLCKLSGKKFQFASSASVYGLNTEFTEESPVDPRTPYSWSKYMFERYVKNNPSKHTTQIFRYFNVYGSNEEHKGSQASPFTQFKIQHEKLGYVKVFKDSENYKRDFVHVDQIVDYHEKFLDVQESGVWNLGTGTTISFLDVAKLYTNDIREIEMPENLKCSYQKYTCADMTKTNLTLEKL
jgi:ADP-L-glycero-D-manno-heptose 6-epimerase